MTAGGVKLLSELHKEKKKHVLTIDCKKVLPKTFEKLVQITFQYKTSCNCTYTAVYVWERKTGNNYIVFTTLMKQNDVIPSGVSLVVKER